MGTKGLGGSLMLIFFLVPVSAQRTDGQMRTITDEVYVTPHYCPHNTSRVTTDPLGEIRELSERDISNLIQEQYPSNINTLIKFNIIPNIWNRHRNELQKWANLGFALYVVLSHPNARDLYEEIINFWFVKRGSRATVILLHNDDDDDGLNMKLEVRSTSRGAEICWSDIPLRFLRQNVMVALFENDDDARGPSSVSVGGRASGSYVTDIPMNPGLQVRLHKAVTHWWRSPTVGEEVWRGPEFHDANGKIPVYVKGYDVSLQLFVKDGKACARLYVRKTIGNWKRMFKDSWVGFYSSAKKATSELYTWGWETEFFREDRSDLEDMPDYDAFVYHSHMAMAPGVQARFVFKYETLVSSPPWE